MLLIIPAMVISGGKCVQPIRGVEGYAYSDDPVEMARLWRTENAKSLHVTDLDGIMNGGFPNAGVIRRMISAVDIPVEIGGPVLTYAAVQEAFELGAYRVVVGTSIAADEAETQRWMRTFGASKIVFGIDAVEGQVVKPGSAELSGEDALTLALRAKALGFRRLLYTEVRPDRTMRGLNLSILRQIGEKTGMRITQSGGVMNLEELLALQDLVPYGVDSVIMGRALCENRFACQAIWRKCEAGNYPFTARV